MTAAAAAISMATTAFPKSGGVRAIAGGSSNWGAKAISSIINELSIPQTVFGAPTSELSHGSLYPFVTRVYPSDAFEAHAIGSVIGAMGWKRIFIVYSQDTYGSDALKEFQDATTGLGIIVVYQFGVQLSQLTVSTNTAQDEAVAALKQFDARIIVLLVSDIQAVAGFLQQADSAGLITANTILMGSSHITTTSLYGGLTSGSAQASAVKRALRGYLGILFADRDWMVTNAGKKFIGRFRALPRTDVMPGSDQCSNATDSEGNRLFLVNTTDKAVCTGLNYGAFAADGSDMEPHVGYTYDATRFMLKSIFLRDDGSFNAPSESTTGTQLINRMILYSGTNGVTGYLNLSAGLNGASDYQRGDRVRGVRFQVVNFVAPNDSVETWGYHRVGTWASEGGFMSCADDPTMQGALTGGCQKEIVWGTVDNKRPSDRADPIVSIVPLGMAAFLLALAILLFVLDIFMIVLLVVYRNSRILKASQLPLMWMVLSSLVFGSLRVLISSTQGVMFSSAGCYAEYWLGHLPFVGLIALMFINGRVYIIVSAGLRKVKVSVRHVLFGSLGLSFAMIMYMILSNIFSPQEVKQYSSMAITGQYTIYNYCEARSVAADAVLYAFEGAILVVNLALCWKTRIVPGIINKSKEIARIISVVTVVAVIVFALNFSTRFEPWVDNLITGLAFAVCCLELCWRYFAPTAYYLVNGYDVDKDLNLVTKTELLAMKVAVSDGTESSSTAVAAKPKAGAIVVKFATEDQRKVVTKFMPSMAPKTIGECNELMAFLRAHVAELAMHTIRFGSDVNSDGSVTGDQSRPGSQHDSTADDDAVQRHSMQRHSMEGQDAVQDLAVVNNLAVDPREGKGRPALAPHSQGQGQGQGRGQSKSTSAGDLERGDWGTNDLEVLEI